MATREEILRFKIEAEGERSLLKLSDGLESVKVSAGASETAAGKLIEQLEGLEKTARAAASFERLSAAASNTSAELLDAREAVDKLGKELEQTDKPSKELTKSFKDAEKAVSKLEKEQTKQTAALSKSGDALREAGVDTTKLASEQARLVTETEKSEKGIQEQAAALRANAKAADDSAKRWDEFKDKLASARKEAGQFATRLAAVTVAAIAAAAAAAAYGAGRLFTSSIEDARNFELAVARIGAATGASTEEINKLRDAAAEAGA